CCCRIKEALTMKEFQAFKDTLSNKALKAIYEESKLEVQDETTEGTEAFSLALATQMAINLLESYEKWLKEERAKEEKKQNIVRFK
ncbi:MAG: hypothetical protein E7D92_00870, partial [Anaerococcus sp.]